MKQLIITGCSNGIGKFLYDNLQDKYKVFGVDKNDMVGFDKHFFQVDLCDVNNLKKELDVLLDERIDGIVNVAGVCLRNRFDVVTDHSFRDVFDNNVISMFNMCKMFYSNLVDSKGSIVNIGSVHARCTLPLYSVYSLSKGAIESFTRGLAMDLSDFDVRVNCLRLGAVDTSMLDYDEDEVCRIPLRHTVNMDDIRSMVVELVENQSITGSVVTLDCGMLSKLSVEM